MLDLNSLPGLYREVETALLPVIFVIGESSSFLLGFNLLLESCLPLCSAQLGEFQGVTVINCIQKITVAVRKGSR